MCFPPFLFLEAKELPPLQAPQAPSADELPPWRPQFPESPEPREICWTPSFTTLRPPRVSASPTVHEAVCEDLDASTSEASEPPELLELRLLLAEETSQREELVELQEHTESRLRACEKQVAERLVFASK